MFMFSSASPFSPGMSFLILLNIKNIVMPEFTTYLKQNTSNKLSPDGQFSFKCFTICFYWKDIQNTIRKYSIVQRAYEAQKYLVDKFKRNLDTNLWLQRLVSNIHTTTAFCLRTLLFQIGTLGTRPVRQCTPICADGRGLQATRSSSACTEKSTRIK